MHQARTFQQVSTYDPGNPAQRANVSWTGTGYSSFYFNHKPNTASLSGLRGLGTSPLSTLPNWAQVAVVAGMAGGALLAYRHLKRGHGLSGARSRRRRRS